MPVSGKGNNRFGKGDEGRLVFTIISFVRFEPFRYVCAVTVENSQDHSGVEMSSRKGSEPREHQVHSKPPSYTHALRAVSPGRGDACAPRSPGAKAELKVRV